MTQLVVAINSISSGSIEPKLWKNLLAQLRQANPIYSCWPESTLKGLSLSIAITSQYH